MPNVKDAKVNFAASQITVYGEATIEELEKAGAFENLRIARERQELKSMPLWKNKGTIRTLISGLLLGLGLFSFFLYGETQLITVLIFISSILIGGFFLFIQGLKNLVRLQFDMKTLMTVAIIGAAAIGEWAEGAAVVFFFAISEWLESRSMEQARQSIRSLMELAPREAIIIRDGQEVSVPVEKIQVGEIMRVKPGQKIAMDGRVVKGSSTVNQAAITGESIPVPKTVNDEVFAGTLNEEGLLEVEVTKKSADNTIAKIIHLVEEAQAKRAPAQAFVDRFAHYYTPLVMLIALLVTIIPPLFLGGVWQDWIYKGLSLLVVACPCALVISTPVSIVTAIGHAARNGVLIKGGVYLEEAGTLSAIAFDKTGTLTKGRPEVTDLITLEAADQILPPLMKQAATTWTPEADPPDKGGRERLPTWFPLVAAIEKGSTHPLAKAIVSYAEKHHLDLTGFTIESFQSMTGKGITAKVNNRTYYIGSPKWMAEQLPYVFSPAILTKINKLQQEGKTVMVAATAEAALGLVAVRDEVRPNSPAAIKALAALGIKKTVMLTGDDPLTAQVIGKALGITEIRARLLPEDKLQVIKELKREHNKVAMVGDGVNDAPALAAATVGVAMGGAGTDTALETADIALMADDITKLPFTIHLSRQTLAVIKQNISFSLCIKLLAMILIFVGWLPLGLAVLADVGATLLVTLNGMRLARVKQPNM